MKSSGSNRSPGPILLFNSREEFWQVASIEGVACRRHGELRRVASCGRLRDVKVAKRESGNICCVRFIQIIGLDAYGYGSLAVVQSTALLETCALHAYVYVYVFAFAFLCERVYVHGHL